MMQAADVQAVAITSGPAYHFFGYYDKFQVDATGTKMLTMEVDFVDRPPTPDDTARIGVIDLSSGNKLEIVAETKAWCWQQSCMLQWLPSAPDRKIIFNVREGGQFRACVLDLVSGDRRVYDYPIYTLAPDGRSALCPNFSRLAEMRPGYGYEGVPDPWADQPAPDDDGIYTMDLETGEGRMIISLAQVTALCPDPEAADSKRWINHLLFSPDSRRFIFLQRWRSPRRKSRAWQTRFFTANADGTDIYCVNEHEMTSHFIWRDEKVMLAWAHRDDCGDHYYRFTDQSDRIEIVGDGQLTEDGHMSYRPQGEWFVTDTYPSKVGNFRRLILFNEKAEQMIELGSFLSQAMGQGHVDCRCDLHPRWSRCGNFITFDSLHEGPRQIYRVDVSKIVG